MEQNEQEEHEFADQLKETYRQRDQNMKHGHKSPLDIIDSFYRDKALSSLLNYSGIELPDCRIIDMGCGTAARLRDFLRLGANPQNLYGLDLSSARIELANQLSPNFNLHEGDARETGFDDDHFDIVINSTMMSSVLDDTISMAIAAEMLRIVKPDGVILWYDLRGNNPWNKNVRGYNKSLIVRHFPDCTINLQSITLPSPLTRRLRLPAMLYHIAHLLPFLRSHYLGKIRPQKFTRNNY